MKKILVLTVTAALVLSIAGCNNNKDTNNDTTTPAPAVITTTTAAPDTSSADNSTSKEDTAAPDDSIDESVAKDVVEELLRRDTEIANKTSKAAYATDAPIDFTDDDGTVWQFALITDDSCPFTSVADIESFINATYTYEYYDGFMNYPLYFFNNGYASMYMDYEGQLLMNVTGGGGGGNIWAYDTISIASATPTEILASCDGQTSYGEPTQIDLSVILTPDGWRINATASL